MCRSNRINCSVFLLFAIAVGLILQSPGSCRADSANTQGIIVPAYFYPGTGGPGGVGDGWAAMAAAAGQVPVTAVFNPDSGPLPGPADPNYVTAMTNLENAGGRAVGYVYTNDGGTPLTAVESQISTYVSQYGSLMNGFYLDGMSVTPSTLSYYQNLDSYIKGLSLSYTVIGNPGQPYLNSVSPANYLSTADIFDIFEGPDTAPVGNPGFNNYPYGQNWFLNYPSDRFTNTIYDVPTTSAMLVDVSTANQLDAGYVYITDQMGPNPYDQLPSYWDQEVSAVASLPEPSPLAFTLILASLLVISARPRVRFNAQEKTALSR